MEWGVFINSLKRPGKTRSSNSTHITVQAKFTVINGFGFPEIEGCLERFEGHATSRMHQYWITWSPRDNTSPSSNSSLALEIMTPWWGGNQQAYDSTIILLGRKTHNENRYHIYPYRFIAFFFPTDRYLLVTPRWKKKKGVKGEKDKGRVRKGGLGVDVISLQHWLK